MTTLYDVTISSISKSSPSDGFVDPYRIDYYRALPDAPKGTDMDTMIVKKKGFVRWHRIECQLQTLGNIYISNISAPGADINTLPTSVSFRLFIEHGSDSLYALDEQNAGQKLTGLNALKRAIARALISALDVNQEVWDPTTVSKNNVDYDVLKFGYRTIEVNVGALAASITEANSHITITAVD